VLKRSSRHPSARAAFLLPLAALLLALPVRSAEPAEREPWRFGEAAGAPGWLKVEGAYRVRYESLQDSFRVAAEDSGSILVERLLFALEAGSPRLYAKFELQDSRAQLHDDELLFGTDVVNAVEPLQLHLGLRRSDLFRKGDRFELKLGRITMDVGSRRLVARNRFRNTINAFTGVHASWTGPGRGRLQAFYTLPVSRLPNVLEIDRLRDNAIQLDQETFDVRFWGLHAEDPVWRGGLAIDLYLYGLNEEDQARVPSRNRDHLTAGARLSRGTGQEPWSFEVESAYQYGESRQTLLSEDVQDLDHRAWFAHTHVSHRFGGAGSPLLLLRYDYASGDRHPDDGRMERFDTLYGARRFEFGPSGVYGALARSNINSPGLALYLEPRPRTNLLFGYRAAWLASRFDRMTTSGVWDPSGQSGSFIGHQIEARLRMELLPGNLELNVGGAYLDHGEFLEQAPNGPAAGQTAYGYAQLELTF
jgi:hypothetical protein